MTFPNKLTRHSKEEKHLLRFTYQQIIYLVCTKTKSKETETVRQTHLKKKVKSEVVSKPNSLIKVWVNVLILKSSFQSLESSLVKLFPVSTWNLSHLFFPLSCCGFRRKVAFLLSCFFQQYLICQNEVEKWDCVVWENCFPQLPQLEWPFLFVVGCLS